MRHAVRRPTVLEESGAVLTREALEAGLSPEDIYGLVRDGTWVRIRRGAYADAETWSGLSPEDRHLVTASAVVRALHMPVALAHVSAAVALGLPVWGADLGDVHVIRPSKRHGSRLEAGVVHHSASLPVEHLGSVDGLPVTTAARTVVDHARTAGFEPGLVTMDAALNRLAASPTQIRDVLEFERDWPGSRSAAHAVSMSADGAESPGETLSRVRAHDAGLPRPRLQASIYDDRMLFVARADMLFEEFATIGEFDGKLKYGLASGAAGLSDILWREKRREDRLRELGYEVVRITWDDLARSPAWWRQKFFRAFARAKGRPRPSGFVV